MYPVKLFNVAGNTHTVYFDTKAERDAFLNDPCYFVSTLQWTTPYVTGGDCKNEHSGKPTRESKW